MNPLTMHLCKRAPRNQNQSYRGWDQPWQPTVALRGCQNAPGSRASPPLVVFLTLTTESKSAARAATEVSLTRPGPAGLPSSRGCRLGHGPARGCPEHRGCLPWKSPQPSVTPRAPLPPSHGHGHIGGKCSPFEGKFLFLFLKCLHKLQTSGTGPSLPHPALGPAPRRPTPFRRRVPGFCPLSLLLPRGCFHCRGPALAQRLLRGPLSGVHGYRGRPEGGGLRAGTGVSDSSREVHPDPTGAESDNHS